MSGRKKIAHLTEKDIIPLEEGVYSIRLGKADRYLSGLLSDTDRKNRIIEGITIAASNHDLKPKIDKPLESSKTSFCYEKEADSSLGRIVVATPGNGLEEMRIESESPEFRKAALEMMNYVIDSINEHNSK